jgi:hypothetical protein
MQQWPCYGVLHFRIFISFFNIYLAVVHDRLAQFQTLNSEMKATFVYIIVLKFLVNSFAVAQAVIR